MTTGLTYKLPYGEVFKSPHSTERNWRTAQENLILLSEAGSRLHGINVGGDDQDLQGVCIEPSEVMLGTRQFELYEYRTKPKGERSGADDIDLQVYGLAKWVRLICNGNPSHLLPLFAPTDKTLALTWPGAALRDNVGLFLAKDHAQKFLGYLNNQRACLVGDKAPRVNRPELIEQFGYDTKYASHALRIAMQGIQLMRIGKLVLPMDAHERRYLIKVREGRYTLGEVLAKLGRLEEELFNAGKYSTVLPEKIDYDYVDDWLVNVYTRWWNGERS
jgi:uncharacterized protein